MQKLYLLTFYPLFSLFLLFEPSMHCYEANFEYCVNDTLEDVDSLTVMYAASNQIYYYDNELTVDENMNNFYATNNRGIKHVLKRYEFEAKDKGHHFLLVLKIQNQQKLNNYSKSIIEQIKAAYNFKEEKLSEIESQLIELTEKANGINH